LVAVHVEDAERRSADKVPAAWRDERIHTGLLPANSDGTCRNRRSWRRAARSYEPLIESAEVGEAGHETDHVDEIVACRVNLDDVLGRHAVLSCDVVEIRTELAAIADWYLSRPRWRQGFIADVREQFRDRADDSQVRRVGWIADDSLRVVVHHQA